jgi:MFS family permease
MPNDLLVQSALIQVSNPNLPANRLAVAPSVETPLPPASKMLWAHATGLLSMGIMTIYGMLVPLYALSLGASPGAIGLVTGIDSLAPLLFAISLGGASDRHGGRKVLLLGSLATIGTGLAYPLITGLWLLGLIQFLSGTFRTLNWIAAQTYVTKIGQGDWQVHQISRFSFATNLGAFGGPLLIGFVTDRFGFPVAFLLTVFMGFLLVFSAWMLPRMDPSKKTRAETARQASNFQSAASLLRNPLILFVIFGTFLRLFLLGIRSSFLGVFLQQASFSTSTIGLLFSLSTVSMTATVPLTGYCARFISKEQFLIAALVTGAISVGLTPLSAELPFQVFVAILYGIGVGFTQPLLISLLADYTPPELRGISVGIRTSANRVASLVSPMMMGFIAQQLNIRMAFHLMAALTMAVIGFSALYRWSKRGAEIRDSRGSTFDVDLAIKEKTS